MTFIPSDGAVVFNAAKPGSTITDSGAASGRALAIRRIHDELVRDGAAGCAELRLADQPQNAVGIGAVPVGGGEYATA